MKLRFKHFWFLSQPTGFLLDFFLLLPKNALSILPLEWPKLRRKIFKIFIFRSFGIKWNSMKMEWDQYENEMMKMHTTWVNIPVGLNRKGKIWSSNLLTYCHILWTLNTVVNSLKMQSNKILIVRAEGDGWGIIC